MHVNLKNDRKIIGKLEVSNDQGQDPGDNKTYLSTLRQFLIDAKLLIGTTAKQKILFSNINLGFVKLHVFHGKP